MTKILLIGAPISDNFGGPSILASIIEVLNKQIPDAEFSLLSPSPKEDKKLADEYNVSIVDRPKTFTFYKLALSSVLYKYRIDISKILDIDTKNLFLEYQSSDVIIDIWGILFAHQMGGGFRRRLIEGLPFYIGKQFRKPVIKYTADIGPFKSYWNSFFASFYFNRIDLIVARSQESKENLLKLKITTPIDVCPDSAFILPATKDHRLKEFFNEKRSAGKKIVGISISHTVDAKDKTQIRYFQTMVTVIEYLLSRYDAFVILIPNNVSPNTVNDLQITHKIFHEIKNPESVYIVDRYESASELKGIIGESDIFVGARYHSIVASISMGIPTIAVSWHHKYQEIMSLVDQIKYVCEIEDLNNEDILQKIDSMFKDRDQLIKRSEELLPDIFKRIYSEGEKIRKILNVYYLH